MFQFILSLRPSILLDFEKLFSQIFLIVLSIEGRSGEGRPYK